MKRVFLIPFILLILLATVNAEELFNCVDSNGNNILTNNPLDGMKCKKRYSDEEPSILRSSNQNKSSGNLIDTCDSLYKESEEINNEIKSFEFRLSELQKEQFYIRQKSANRNWNYDSDYNETQHIRNEQYKINKQISLLNQKQSLIRNDIRMHKCDQMKSDLSRLNQGSISNNPASPKIRKNTIIMRNGGRAVIIRD